MIWRPPQSRWLPRGSVILLGAGLALSCACAAGDKIPIATSSEEARQSYLEGAPKKH